jgi:hypothetical protein
MNRHAVETFLATRRSASDWSDGLEALACLALTLADTLDAGAGMAIAAVSRELRATLDALTPRGESDAFTRIAAELSATLGDSTH